MMRMNPPETKRPVRFSVTSLLALMLAVALAIGAFQRFAFVAIQFRAMIAGALIFMIAVAVGGVVGTQRAPRWLMIAACFVFYVCLVNGTVKNVGDELTMWALLCMSTGLMIGAFFCDASTAAA